MPIFGTEQYSIDPHEPTKLSLALSVWTITPVAISEGIRFYTHRSVQQYGTSCGDAVPARFNLLVPILLH